MLVTHFGNVVKNDWQHYRISYVNTILHIIALFSIIVTNKSY